MVQPEQVILAAVSALVYSLVFFAKSRANDPEENINYFKLGATVAVGVGVGVSYGLAGIDFSQMELSTQLTAYAGTIAIIESLLKVLWRQYLRDIVGSASGL